MLCFMGRQGSGHTYRGALSHLWRTASGPKLPTTIGCADQLGSPARHGVEPGE